MTNDIELNISQQNPRVAGKLRKDLWKLIIGDAIDEIMTNPVDGYKVWKQRIEENDKIGNVDFDAQRLQYDPRSKLGGAEDPWTQDVFDQYQRELSAAKKDAQKKKETVRGQNIPNGLALTYEPFYRGSSWAPKKNW